MTQNYYEKFYYFFNDVSQGRYSDLIFVRKVLQELDCSIFCKGQNIVQVGQQFINMYFCFKNGCNVVDPFLGLNISFLNEGSFFGELQVLLGLNSSYDYESS